MDGDRPELGHRRAAARASHATRTLEALRVLPPVVGGTPPPGAPRAARAPASVSAPPADAGLANAPSDRCAPPSRAAPAAAECLPHLTDADLERVAACRRVTRRLTACGQVASSATTAPRGEMQPHGCA